MRSTELSVPGAMALAISLCLSTGDAAAQGRIKWRYQAQADYFSTRPVVAPDGTVYAVDIAATLHAIAPDGTPRWTLADAGRSGVDVAADGTVYVGDGTKIVAVDPSGTVRWTYPLQPASPILLGPTVGPDGNVYGVAPSGVGIFSLTPSVTLRWSTPEPRHRPHVNNQEMVFRTDAGGGNLRMIFSGHGHLAEVDTRNGSVTDLTSGGDHQPVVGPNRDVFSTASNELRAIRDDGTLRWSFFGPTLTSLSDPTVAADGVVYAVRLGRLHALRAADGTSMWEHWDMSSLLHPMANPSNTMVLVGGRTQGNTDFVRAVSPQGSLMWQVDLSTGPGGPSLVWNPARFTPDGNTAYVPTGGGTGTCWLYALDTSPDPRAEVWTWGRACPGVSNRIPVLGFTGRPVLGRSFAVDLSDARASAAVVHVIGGRQTGISFEWLGAPGCTVYSAPDVIVRARSDAAGRASTLVPVPNVGALAGLTVFHQFFVADPVNRLGVVATVGGASQLGR